MLDFKPEKEQSVREAFHGTAIGVRDLNQKPIPADNLKKYNTKHNPKISILKPKI